MHEKLEIVFIYLRKERTAQFLCSKKTLRFRTHISITIIVFLQAINYYYDRCLATKDDPYLETREKEDAFVDRIADMVDQKVLCNIPALAGMYLMQQQAFVSASIQSGVTPVMPRMNQQMQEGKNDLNVDTTESNADVEENELVDFNIF